MIIEKMFLFYTDNLKDLNISNLEGKIILNCKNLLALNNNIFSDLVCENISLLDRPHKMVLIQIIIKEYLSARLHTFGKMFSTNILNPVNKRHTLTKAILFYHQ